MSRVDNKTRIEDDVKRRALAVLAENDLAMSAGALSDAASLLPEDPEIAFHLGTVMLRLERLDAAAFHLERARARAPDVAAIHSNLATALLRMTDVEHAIAVAEDGLARQPNAPPLHNVMANALVEGGRPERAATHYERALDADPGYRAARINLANVRRDLGETLVARGLYAKVLAEDEGDVETLIGLAMLEGEDGDGSHAITLYRLALERAPRHVRALNNLGILLMGRGEWHDAQALFRDGALLWRENAEIHGNLAQCLQAMGRHEEALESFEAAFALDPDAARLRPFQLYSLLQVCAREQLEAQEAEVLVNVARDAAACPPFVLAETRTTPALRRHAAEDFSRRLRARLHPADPPRSARTWQETAPLRVGFISPDFRGHSLGLSFMGPLAAFDRRRFRWYGYSLARDDEDEWSARFRRDFDHFQPLTGLAPAAAARRITEDEIDVLVDLAGHTRHSALEILAYRPAPVHAHYLGQGATLGAPWSDYLLTDAVHTPAALKPHVCEAPLRLPGSFMASESPEIGPILVRGETGLPELGIVMACFNAPAKIHPNLLHVWMRLMRRLPASLLWLMPGSDVARANLCAEAERHLVDPRRLIFANRVARKTHLARLRHADLALNTSPHAGGATTLDALWADLPVVTLAGPAQASRTGASILAAMDLRTLVAGDAAEYQEIAFALADDAGMRAEMRTAIARGREIRATFDPAQKARDLERAFEAMARRHARGLPPATLDLAGNN